ncbi:hypothetical protein DL96DRAFT_366041 [Flagelloscypha sp. PMI_526]|nr:hypothetical protein DL96DRAFT_366041 [Flagelloscypha sp. PMI_526]
MAESDSLGHKTVLPIEIFENIIGFHFNDFPTLAACGLSLSVLLPACRRTRFHTITLHSERRNASPVCTIFEEILRVSPIISQHVYRVRILDPGDFNVDGSDPGSILNIPSQLSNVTNIICSETVAYGWGIFWHRCLWLLDGISSLSALQTVTIESNRFQTELYTSPWSQKIHKLDIFKPFMKPVEGVRQLQPHPRLHLCTLSLNCLEQVEGFSSGDVEQRLHLSKLRHISLSLIVGGLHASSFGAWLSTLAADCPISLQTVVLDINRNTGDVLLPFQMVPNLQRQGYLMANFPE